MKRPDKFWILLLAAFCLAAGAAIFAANSNSNLLAVVFNRQALIQRFAQTGQSQNSQNSSSVGFFLLAHVAANAVGIPGTLLVIVGGSVYGLWWGALWSTIGATMGAVAAFGMARYFLHDWFAARFHHRPLMKRLNQTLQTNGLGCVLVIRFSPVSPFNVVNFAFGLTPVPLRLYIFGTFIGILPGTLAYTWLGVSGADVLSGGSLLPLGCCLTVLMLLSALPLLTQRHRSS